MSKRFNGTLPTLQEVLQRPWWTTADVATYLGYSTPGAANTWMWRAQVRRCKENNRLTCREWVDAALNRKS